MREIIERIIADYGSTVTAAENGGERSFRAFLQPVTSKSWQNMERVFGPLGEIPRGQYLYIGPAEQDISGADHLRCGGVDYIVRRAEPILVGDEALYLWGLCVRKGADDPWSS